MNDEYEGAILTHQPCGDCGSSDALSEYATHTFCFSCRKHSWTTDGGEAVPKDDARPTGKVQIIARRKLKHLGTLQRYVVETDAGGATLFHYFSSPAVWQATKVRPSADNKDNIHWVGNASKPPLYGAYLQKPTARKSLVIAEGEFDALTLANVLPLDRYHCVSLPGGTASVAGVLRDHWDYLQGWREVILAGDNDEPGLEAIDKLANALVDSVPVAIVQWPSDIKDANEANAKGHDINALVEGAAPFRPSNIHDMHDLIPSLSKPIDYGLPIMFEGLSDRLGGYRAKELWTIVAGTGVGKSTLVGHLTLDLLVNHGKRPGIMFLEENSEHALRRLLGIHMRTNLLRPNSSVSTREQIEAAEKLFPPGTCYTYDHFGNVGSEALLQRMSYMANAVQCDYIILDHITMASTLPLSGGNSQLTERQGIDALTTEIRSRIVEGCGVGVIMVSHTRKPTNGDHSDGSAPVRMSDIRGSGSIAQMSDAVISISKSKDTAGDIVKNAVDLAVIKNRFSGNVGPAGTLIYDDIQGRLADSTAL